MHTKTLLLAFLAVATASAASVPLSARQNQNQNQCQNNQNQNDSQNQNQNNQNQNNQNNNNAGQANAGEANADAGAVDFGTCIPTMSFEFGRAGRGADEGTFLPTDAVVAQGQQDALNPNIITNRICDQLTNVCDANEAAVTLCESAQAEIEALGTRDATTADAFNAALGF
ncbi:hypothetical protein B0O99DRAFT_125700 [Bisporella sp. PMI_857]|nr:hypothetical protein B0O99DRAFT_125700 [Bisporella sp. PMI_857]